MIATARVQQSYDHRLKLRIFAGDENALAATKRLDIPRSTVHGWKRACKSVVTDRDVDPCQETLQSKIERLHCENQSLRSHNTKLKAWLRLALMLFRMLGVSLENLRLDDPLKKRCLIKAIDRAKETLPLRSILKAITLSESRYYHWKNASPCQLEYRSSCPHAFPNQLTSDEVRTIREMVTSNEYRHVPTRNLATLAARLGKVYASASSWLRLIHLHGWRRPRTRIHPHKPTLGVRVNAINQIWHVDTTIIKLVDGTKVYIRAVIDNFSRRILAYKVQETFDASNTADLLVEAGKHLNQDDGVDLYCDSGVENLNEAVDAVLAKSSLRRVIAQVDVQYSNSMIEAFWRIMKTNWLYLNKLDSFATVEKQVNFYIDQYNRVIPHSAHSGQTPDEIYFKTGINVPSELQAAAVKARVSRREVNLTTKRCQSCQPQPALVQIESQPSTRSPPPT
jgi:putative transposase